MVQSDWGYKKVTSEDQKKWEDVARKTLNKKIELCVSSWHNWFEKKVKRIISVKDKTVSERKIFLDLGIVPEWGKFGYIMKRAKKEEY